MTTAGEPLTVHGPMPSLRSTAMQPQPPGQQSAAPVVMDPAQAALAVLEGANPAAPSEREPVGTPPESWCCLAYYCVLTPAAADDVQVVTASGQQQDTLRASLAETSRGSHAPADERGRATVKFKTAQAPLSTSTKLFAEQGATVPKLGSTYRPASDDGLVVLTSMPSTALGPLSGAAKGAHGGHDGPQSSYGSDGSGGSRTDGPGDAPQDLGVSLPSLLLG